MALSDLFKDLDPSLASVLSEATEALRGEFEEKLAATRAELGLEPAAARDEGESAAPAPSSTPAPDATEAPVGPDLLDPIEELKHAVVAVDRSSSQGEVLTELLAGCSRFASRCAIFLLREGQVSGWSSFGFAADSEQTRAIGFEVEAGSPWERLERDEGAVPLDAVGGSAICDKLGGEPPQLGVLIPFVLGNQTAAAIYCDSLGDDAPPNITALQLLAFIASQVLENLPVRDRVSTSTLSLAGTAPDAGPAVEAATLPVDESADEPAAEGEEPEATIEEAPPEEAEPVEIERVEEIEEIQAEPSASMPAVDEHDLGGPDLAPELPEPPMEPAAMEFEEPEETGPEEMAADTAAAVVEPPEAAVPSPEPTFEEVEPEPEPAPAPPSPEAATPQAVAEAPADGEAMESAETESITAEGGTQVAPPEDLEGPGWAFSGGRDQGHGGADDAQHEEARRLARLLVTEVKLYNEELVEEGRRKGDVYSVLKEDIDRSRQIFDDRIDEDVRSQSDYFREALVRILAGGDPEALGL